MLDWFTVGAQIFNFVILLYLLKRFLYKPVITAMENRREKVRTALEDADRIKADAEKVREEYAGKTRELETTRDAVLAEARKKADALETSLVQTAREQVEASRTAWLNALEDEKVSFLDTVQDAVKEQFAETIQLALTDLSGTTLADALQQTFLQILRSPTEQELAELESFAAHITQTVRVFTPEPLTEEQKTTIQDAITGRFGEIAIQFSEDPSLISGIELAADHKRLRWSISGWLALYRSELESAFFRSEPL